ncbi:unnamed protein product [Penicillium salamii]|nr:unnamed protein product [Penicillium salamii]
MWLQIFWGEEKANEWKGLILRDDETVGVHRVCNLMTLDSVLRTYWDEGLVAFRPVSVNKDQTEMQIAIHWLPLRKYLDEENMRRRDKVILTENPLKDRRFLPKRTPGEGYYLCVFEEDGTPVSISSGHIFTVKTTDSKERPLPSFELLELRWHLSRIGAMQGSPKDEEDDRADDESSDEYDDGYRDGCPDKIENETEDPTEDQTQDEPEDNYWVWITES